MHAAMQSGPGWLWKDFKEIKNLFLWDLQDIYLAPNRWILSLETLQGVSDLCWPPGPGDILETALSETRLCQAPHRAPLSQSEGGSVSSGPMRGRAWAEFSLIWQPGSLSVLRTWRERNQASSGARPVVRLVTLFYQTNILLFVSRQIMVPARGLPAQHLALLYDQSLQKELGPWNKADKIGRQWRCCSLSWRLLSPRVSEECGESLTGSARRVRSQEPASTDQISHDNYTLWF